MERTKLLDKLQTVAPALADSDLVPILSHFWFRGDRLMAYNDQIAIATKFPTPFKGAVAGRVLLDLLRHSKAKEVSFEVKDKELNVKAAISRFKLGLLPAEDFLPLFDMPAKTQDQQTVEVKSVPEFLDAVESCMRSVTNDTSTPDQLGVTLMPKDKELLLFSTDSATLSHARVTLTETSGLKKRAILAGAFCREMLRVCAHNRKEFSLRIANDYSLLTLPSGDVLFGRLIHSENPVSYIDIYNHHFSPKETRSLVAIPTAMRLILERACIISDAARTRTRVTVEGGEMKFYSKSPVGEIHDTMQIEGRHPPIRAMLEARLLKAGYGSFDRMVVTDKCLVMTKGRDNKQLYMISATEN